MPASTDSHEPLPAMTDDATDYLNSNHDATPLASNTIV